MRILSLDLTRLPNLITVSLLRWRRQYTWTELENLSDETLEDVGLQPAPRDFDSVKPFWMP
jgi:uncharacterized protein YjiS (DUF1127 family)